MTLCDTCATTILPILKKTTEAQQKADYAASQGLTDFAVSLQKLILQDLYDLNMVIYKCPKCKQHSDLFE